MWKASHQGGHVIYIPADVIKDSAYPFSPLDDVDVELDAEKQQLIIRRR